MIPNFNTSSIENERDLVAGYIGRKSYYKKYPKEYLENIAPLIEKMYNIFKIEPNVEILNDPSITEAYEFAKNAHAQQERKYIKTEYIHHPVELANTLSSIPGITKEEIIAALLHDVIEDSDSTKDDIEKKFGSKVERHVHYLTDHAKPEDGNRETRTKINFDYFKLSPESTKNIKLADLVSNSRSVFLCDPGFNVNYMPALKVMRDYFHTIENVISPVLLKQLDDTITIGEQVMKLQDKYNIAKLDKKSSKHIESINEKQLQQNIAVVNKKKMK